MNDPTKECEICGYTAPGLIMKMFDHSCDAIGEQRNRIRTLEAENAQLKAQLSAIRKEVAEECAKMCEERARKYGVTIGGLAIRTMALELRQKFNITD